MRRRCVAALLTLLMLTTFLPGTQAGAETSETLEVTVQRTATTFWVEVSFPESQTVIPEGTLFCVVYGENGQMLEVQTAALSQAGAVQIPFETPPVQGQVVKVILLDPSGWAPLSIAGVGEVPGLPEPGEDETEDVFFG